MGSHKYKAFISYSHKDDRWGRWLHRRLENYPLPKNIVGNITKTGPIPKRLTPIFRDREELAAADSLGEKIEQALSQSENLIMICSPAAARSHWVNQEVLYFKRHNRGAQIFSVIVEGEPFASNMPGREDEECFPPALRYQLDEDGELSDTPAEPLAADVRDHADGKRLGVLKLVSGMIGVGLDEVVQRDMRKTRKRVMGITLGSLTTVLVMGTMTTIALKSRNEALYHRVNAEELIDFMLVKVRPVFINAGSLSDTTRLNEQMLKYFEGQTSLTNLTVESLLRRAKIIGGIGEDDENRGNFELAEKKYHEMYRTTSVLLEKKSKSSDILLSHAQSANRLGLFAHSQSGFAHKQQTVDAAFSYLKEAKSSLEKIPLIDRNKKEWRTELTFVHANICAAMLKVHKANKINYESYKKIKPKIDHCELAISVGHQLKNDYPDVFEFQYNLIFPYITLSDVWKMYGDEVKAAEARNAYMVLSEELFRIYGANDKFKNRALEVRMEACTHFADNLRDAKMRSEAIVYFQEALRINKRLVDRDADNKFWADYNIRLRKEISNQNN